jgi:NAD(P)-dependent dehydrogenase (short-subunit alcohol dehydrogenase family)
MYSNASTAAQLRDSYYADAANIERYIEKLKAKMCERPDPRELSDLELRTATLREERRELIESIPACRPGTPADAAEAVRFLASPAASYICGQVLRVDGGWI